MLASHLIAMDHQVVSGDQSLEDHNPASIPCSLKQGISHLWNIDIGLLGCLDQVCEGI